MAEEISEEMDQPEDNGGWGLVFPFVVCESHGGPYADEPFVAGYQAGGIDTALGAAKALGATSARFTVRSPLMPQLELIAMHHGFPVVQVVAWEEHPDEWSVVTFTNDETEPDHG